MRGVLETKISFSMYSTKMIGSASDGEVYEIIVSWSGGALFFQRLSSSDICHIVILGEIGETVFLSFCHYPDRNLRHWVRVLLPCSTPGRSRPDLPSRHSRAECGRMTFSVFLLRCSPVCLVGMIGRDHIEFRWIIWIGRGGRISTETIVRLSSKSASSSPDQDYVDEAHLFFFSQQ